MISDIIAVLALITSTLALWQATRLKRVAYYAEIAQVEAQLGELPEVLRFHGLREEDLSAVGLTSAEFAYLLKSLLLEARGIKSCTRD